MACAWERISYSILPGEVISVEVVLKFLKFGVKASLQFVTSSEDAQKSIWNAPSETAKLTNHFLPLAQLFKVTYASAVQLYVPWLASYSKADVFALPVALPAGDLYPISCQLPAL